jgi:hypothetical protein
MLNPGMKARTYTRKSQLRTASMPTTCRLWYGLGLVPTDMTKVRAVSGRWRRPDLAARPETSAGAAEWGRDSSPGSGAEQTSAVGPSSPEPIGFCHHDSQDPSTQSTSGISIFGFPQTTRRVIDPTPTMFQLHHTSTAETRNICSCRSSDRAAGGWRG